GRQLLFKVAETRAPEAVHCGTDRVIGKGTGKNTGLNANFSVFGQSYPQPLTFAMEALDAQRSR
ncbi:MAG: hypothetical protein Q7R45_16065, partial [Sulfuricaulis sp.]|nr:hypothetical protein [Sulfuricaulis sp.]